MAFGIARLLLTKVYRHAETIAKNPRVDLEKVRKIRYLYEFDRYVCHEPPLRRSGSDCFSRELQGPTWGYPTEGAYYRDAASCDSILAVRIPLFALNAEDDPVSPAFSESSMRSRG